MMRGHERELMGGWIRFNVVDVCGPQWLYPIVGIGAARGIVYDEKKESEAKKIVAGFMAAVEAYLSAHDAVFLVDNALSLADIVGASGLSNVYCYLVPRSEWQANYPKLLRWIETVYATQEWLESVGTMPVCEQAATYDPSGPKELPRPVKYVEEWPSARVRDTFVNYFVEKQGHVNWPSSPAVPVDDPTLLFANAGMNQYKTDLFSARLIRRGARQAHQGDEYAKVHSRRREAQRFGRCRKGHVPSHVL